MLDNDFLDLVENGKMKSGSAWGCGVILIDPQTYKIPLARRTDTKTFGTPGGKIEVGETPKQGIIRECKEESNIKINSMICYDYSLHRAPNGKNWTDFLFLSTDFDASKMRNQESEMEPFEWYTIQEALHLDLFPPSRKGLETAIELGIINPMSEVPFNETFSNADGNGYFPSCSNCEYNVNPYYEDKECCSYSYNPDTIDWL